MIFSIDVSDDLAVHAECKVPVAIRAGKALISQQPLLNNLSFWRNFRDWWCAENERAGRDPDYANICCAEAESAYLVSAGS